MLNIFQIQHTIYHFKKRHKTEHKKTKKENMYIII